MLLALDLFGLATKASMVLFGKVFWNLKNKTTKNLKINNQPQQK
tara:strand:- start:367 stop:498 length:132 start_codon:yes stop_codon:yes gene_type:complete